MSSKMSIEDILQEWNRVYENNKLFTIIKKEAKENEAN